METMEILKLAVMIIVGYFILKFIWNAVGGVIKLIVVVVLVAVGIYFVNPTLLHNALGKENVEKVVNEVTETTTELTNKAKEAVKDKAEEVADSTIKKVTE